LVIFAFALVAWLLAGTPTFGHASLVSSEPKDGAVVPAAPAALTLRYNEPVQPIVLRLIDPAGGSATLTDYRVEGNNLVVMPPQSLGQGTHALSWRVISTDGHPIGGALVFAIGAPSATRSSLIDDATDRWLRVTIWLTRALLYLALFVGIGGSLFSVSVGTAATLPPVARTSSMAAILLGFVAVPLSIGLQGLDVLLKPLSGLIDVQSWRAGYATSFGTTATLAFIALVAAYTSLQLRDRRMRALLGVAGLAGLGAAFIASGHVSSAEPRLVSRTALFVHVVSIAFWIGALIPLLSLMSSKSPATGPVLERFSRAIPLPLAALVASGVVLAVIQLGHVDALWRSAYGWVFSLKLALLLGLFGIAAVNRLVLTPTWRRKAEDARPRFVGTLTAELVLVALILATVALWRFTPPPRAFPAAGAEPLFAHIHTDKAMADVTIARSRAGVSQISITLRTGDLRPLPAKEVTLLLANPAAGIEPISRQAVLLSGQGIWRVDEFTIPTSGNWTVNVEVLIGDFERVELKGQIEIKP
jgi:copper transport protein